MAANRGASELVKFMALADELRTSLDLVRHGFRSLQEIDFGNDFYRLPHHLLAIGLERFMKCYVCLAHRSKHGVYPSDLRGKYSHNLRKLLDGIVDDHFGTPSAMLEEDHRFLSKDKVLRGALEILTHFGHDGRYHNLDIVTGNTPMQDDPKEAWQDLERRVVDPMPYAGDLEAMRNEYYPKVNRTIIAALERMIQAISRQFTLGGHADPNGDMRRLWSYVSDFAVLQEMGTTDYRVLLEPQRRVAHVWERGPPSGRYPTKTVRKRECGSEWPFRSGEVVVECRRGTFAIAYLKGYAYSLNGAAKSRFNYPDPHEMGVAVFGKSVGPFIELAFSLAK